MNLTKALQQTQTKRAEQPIPGQAANLRKMLGRKSGKAGATTGPAQSSIQEQQAIANFGTQATQQQQAAQADVGAQQLAAKEQQQQAAQTQQRMTLQQQQAQQRFDQQAQQIANNLQRFKDDLASKEGQQALAEAVFARRLADKQYMTDLQRAGQERRLLDNQAFELEAGKAAFDNWQELFQDNEQFSQMLRMEDAEFRKNLARMGPTAARELLASQAAAANRVSQIESYADLASTVLQAGTEKYKTTDKYNTKTEASFLERMFSDKDFTSADTRLPGPAEN